MDWELDGRVQALAPNIVWILVVAEEASLPAAMGSTREQQASALA